MTKVETRLDSLYIEFESRRVKSRVTRLTREFPQFHSSRLLVGEEPRELVWNSLFAKKKSSVMWTRNLEDMSFSHSESAWEGEHTCAKDLAWLPLPLPGHGARVRGLAP
jgi:hypothetical protein